MPGLEAAKAYVALLGSIATALLGVFTADTAIGQVLTVIVVLATGFATYAVPNRRKTVLDATGTKRNEFGYVNGGPGFSWVWVVVLVVLILILPFVAGVIHH